MEVVKLIGAIIALIMMTVLGFGYIIPIFLYCTQGIWESIKKRKRKFDGYPQKLIDAERRILELEFELEKYTEKDTPSKKTFWTQEMRTLYQSHRFKLAKEENIEIRIDSLSLSPSYRALIPPSELKKRRDSRPNKEVKHYYETTLTSCTCDDFKYNTKRKSACKHMFALALHLGLINEQGEFTEKSE